MKLKVIGCGIGMSLCLQAAAQDIPLTQYLSSPVYLNPAAAGFLYPKDVRVVGNFRNADTYDGRQPNMKAVVSADLGAMHDFWRKGDYIGVSFTGAYSQTGSGGINAADAALGIAYNHAMGRAKLQHIAIGAQLNMIQKQVNTDFLTHNDFYGVGSDMPLLVSGTKYSQSTFNYSDINAGFMYYGQISSRWRLEVGYAAKNFLSSEQQFLKLRNVTDIRHNIHAHATYDLGSKYVVNASSLVAMQNSYTEVLSTATIGMFLNKASDEAEKLVHVGGCYRFNRSVAPIVMLDWKNYHLGVSYDFNTTSETRGYTVQRSAAEVHFSYIKRRRPLTTQEIENDYSR